MKRLHLHIGVKDLDQSVQFYSVLFGQKPTKLKPDYAKWMLDDPKVNFAISTRTHTKGLDHLGIQVDEDSELVELTERLKKADLSVYDEGATTCCYAESKKAWVQDPTGLAWEAYQTMNDAEVFHKTKVENTCCVSDSVEKSNCC